MLTPKALGEDPSWPGILGVHMLVDASLQSLPPASCGVLCACLCPNFPLTRTSVIGLGPTRVHHDLILT